ncbi:MAG TPA: sporulation integral membrane protein YtvI, partial [Symbiobacteriaceae bacterium]|nr:sporulation integral membrane protein YtvI [Symbiobacteriaceae bacterium]
MVRPWLYSVLGLVGFLVGVWVLLSYGLPLVMPFVIALVVAELIDPVVNRLSGKRRLPRTLAVTLVLLTFVTLFTTAATAGIARLVEEIRGVINNLPHLYAYALDLGTLFAEQFGRVNEALPGSIQEMLATNLAQVQKSLSDSLPKMGTALGVVSSVPVFVTNMLIALIATFFISRDKALIGQFLLSLFPSVWRPKLSRVKDDVWTSTMGWAKAQFMLILLTMLQTIVGLSLIGSNYAVTMGVVVGIADMLPVLGPASIYLPWILYCLIFGSKIFGLKLLVLYALVAGIRQVLEAKLVGDQIGLHPLAILVSLYLGFHFFGALGVVAGPLIAILLKSMIKSGLLPIFQDDKP